MDWGNAVGELRRRSAQLAEFVKETAFELTWDARDAAKTGFGVPKLMASAASFSVATVAAVGVASVAFDLGGKVWGKRECGMCNGWEGLRCQICNGAGRVRYTVDESRLSESERSTSRGIAEAAVDGRASIDYVVPGTSPNLPFPHIDCPQCDGTGVMICRSCSGSPWVPKFTIARAINAPWLTWDAYRKIQPSSQPRDARSTMDLGMFVDDVKANEDNGELVLAIDEKNKVQDQYLPKMAGEFQRSYFAFDFLRAHVILRAVILGVQSDEMKSEIIRVLSAKVDVLTPISSDTLRSFTQEIMHYDIIREEVKKRGPMWEELQEILKLQDPLRAARDDVIELDPSYYEAKVKVLNEINKLPVPARPAGWLDIAKPLSESDWTNEKLVTDPGRRSEMKTILALQDDFYEKLLDRTWENHWRTEKFEEVKKERIASYEFSKDGHQRQEPMQVDAELDAGTPTVSRKGQEKPAPEKKVDSKKRQEDDKKRRERQERSERMAKQAADREAALMRAKTARERRDSR